LSFHFSVNEMISYSKSKIESKKKKLKIRMETSIITHGGAR